MMRFLPCMHWFVPCWVSMHLRKWFSSPSRGFPTIVVFPYLGFPHNWWNVVLPYLGFPHSGFSLLGFHKNDKSLGFSYPFEFFQTLREVGFSVRSGCYLLNSSRWWVFSNLMYIWEVYPHGGVLLITFQTSAPKLWAQCIWLPWDALSATDGDTHEECCLWVGMAP